MGIQNAYDEWSDTYDTDENLTRDLDQQVTREALKNQQFDSVLEIGCGTGKNTRFLIDVGVAVHALDFSKGMIAKAREKVKVGNVRFSMADLTQTWPCDDEAYDLIVCNLVLEHIEDLSSIFSESYRVLVEGGKFLINELHPFRQYEGRKARFEKDAQTIQVDAFVHHVSDFVHAASTHGFSLSELNEHWHERDLSSKPPRLISFLFEKRSSAYREPTND